MNEWMNEAIPFIRTAKPVLGTAVFFCVSAERMENFMDESEPCSSQ